MQLGIYEHYSKQRFLVIGVGRHSETLEEVVVYHHLDGECGLWVRPLAMFQENVLIEGKQVPRFTFIQEAHTQGPTLR